MSQQEMLPGPFELVELHDQQILELTVLDFKMGDLIIHPRFPGAPAEKRIRGLRIFVPQEEKPAGPPYRDFTSGTLIVQLQPFLAGLKARKGRVRVQAFGVAPSKRFTVTVL